MTKLQSYSSLNYVQNAPVKIDGELYAFMGVLPGGRYNFVHARTGAMYQYCDADTGEVCLPDARTIEFLLGNNRFEPIWMRPGGFNPRPVIDEDIQAIVECDANARGRQAILRHYDEYPVRLSDASLGGMLESIKADILGTGMGKIPHPATVRRWIKRRGASGDRPLAQMVSLSGRVARHRAFHPRVEHVITSELGAYWMRQGTTVGEVVDKIQAFVDQQNEHLPSESKLKKPSAETIRTRLRNSETGELYKQKYGEKAWRVKYRTPFDQRINASKILGTAIVDHTVIDTMLVLSAKHRAPLGRPTLALMVDVASRCILAVVVTFEKPSLHTVNLLLKRALRPKPALRKRFPDAPDGAGIFGCPSTIVYDRAVETIGVSHRDAMADLGIEIIYAGAGEPQAKGIVERLFRTLNNLLFHRLPGSVHLPASLMRDMGYDPEDTAVLTIEELEHLLEEAINVYHYQTHSALMISPIQYWIEQSDSISTLSDVSVLDKMMGIVHHRTLSRAGIQFSNLVFSCERNVPLLMDALAAHERTKHGKRKGSATATVKVKVNPDDISTVQVFNPVDNQYYELKCTDPEYAAGTSLWQHEAIRKYAKVRGDDFKSPAGRRALRLALARSIEEACPEIGLKAKRARKRLHDTVRMDKTFEGEDLIVHEQIGAEYDVIPKTVAAGERGDGGRPQHSPQRGKTARKCNASMHKAAATGPKADAAQKSKAAKLIAVTDTMRAQAQASWR